jgi:hypothetical protein
LAGGKEPDHRRDHGLSFETARLVFDVGWFEGRRAGTPGLARLCCRHATLDRAMTALLDRALEAARTLPPAAQDDIARVVLRLAGTDDEVLPVELTADEQAAIAVSKAAAARGEFATDEEIRAVWAKHSL